MECDDLEFFFFLHLEIANEWSSVYRMFVKIRLMCYSVSWATDGVVGRQQV